MFMRDVSYLTYILDIATSEEHTGSCHQRSLIIHSGFKQFRRDIYTIGTFNKVALDAEAFFHKPLISKRWKVHISHHNFITLTVVKSRSNAAQSSRDIGSDGNFMQLCSDNGSKLLTGPGNLTHPNVIPCVRTPLVPHLHELRYPAH